MDRPGEQFLARARLAPDERRSVRLGDLLDLVRYGAQCGALAEDAG